MHDSYKRKEQSRIFSLIFRFKVYKARISLVYGVGNVYRPIYNQVRGNFFTIKTKKSFLNFFKFILVCDKGPSIKDVRSQGRGGSYPMRTFCGQGGFFRRGCPHFSTQKKLRIFQNLWCVLTDKEGLIQC